MIRPGNLPDALIAYARGKSPRFGPGDLAAERLPAAVAIELGRCASFVVVKERRLMRTQVREERPD